MIATPVIANKSSREPVFFVHGFLSKRLLMKPLQWQVGRYGFPTAGWGYPSYLGSLKWHASRLRPVLEQFSRQHEQFHVVAHSMGSIVFRLAMEYGPLNGLGRVVLMAPPNQGTPTARLISPLFCLFCAGVPELSDKPASLVHHIKTPQPLEIGIIAGRFDWIVPRSRTPLPCQVDHICVKSTHNTMLVQPRVARRVVEFLENGHFQRETS
ncbi:MAG: esterase/lipase family protein [Pirellulaceae bacterium]